MTKPIAFIAVIFLTIWASLQLVLPPFNLPAYPGAREIENWAVADVCSHKTLTTTASPRAVADFYRGAMTQVGWHPTHEMGGDAELSFERSTLFERYSASIAISAGNASGTLTRVSLNSRNHSSFDACNRSMLIDP